MEDSIPKMVAEMFNCLAAGLVMEAAVLQARLTEKGCLCLICPGRDLRDVYHRVQMMLKEDVSQNTKYRHRAKVKEQVEAIEHLSQRNGHQEV